MGKSRKNTTAPKSGSATLWIALIALVIGLVGGFMVAKVKYSAKITTLSIMYNQKDGQLNELKAQANRMMLLNGQMYVMKDGQLSPMTEDMILTNGSKVMKNGEVVLPGGKTMMMGNGDSIGMDGTVLGQKMKGVQF